MRQSVALAGMVTNTVADRLRGGGNARRTTELSSCGPQTKKPMTALPYRGAVIGM